MRYVASVFYEGARTSWSGKTDPGEVIFQIESRWLWLARVRAISALGNLGRCGYEIKRGDQVIEREPAIAGAYST